MNNITYVDVALTYENERIYGGVELLRKVDVTYEPYHVISYAAPVNLPSIKRVVPVLLSEALSYVDPAHNVVIFRSFNRAFQRSTELEQTVGMGRGVTVKLVYVPYDKFTRNHGTNTLLLANDAIRRGESLSVEV